MLSRRGPDIEELEVVGCVRPRAVDEEEFFECGGRRGEKAKICDGESVEGDELEESKVCEGSEDPGGKSMMRPLLVRLHVVDRINRAESKEANLRRLSSRGKAARNAVDSDVGASSSEGAR